MPLRERGFRFLLLEAASDSLAVAGGLAGAYWLRFHAGIFPVRHLWNPRDYLLAWPVAFAVWLVSLRLTHCYRNHPMVISFNLARQILKGSLLAVAILVAYEHFSRVAEFSRLMYPVALVCTLGTLLAMRGLLQRLIRWMFASGTGRDRVLIVGTGPIAARLAARCVQHPEYGYEVAGFVAASPDQVGRVIEGIEVVGEAADLSELIQRHHAREVIVTSAELPPEEYIRLALDSERETARIRIVPNMVEMMTGDVFYDEVAGIPIFMLKETPLRGWNAFAKRTVDVAGSALMLGALAPLYPLVAWLIRRESPGPVFYRQRRVGVDGREFEIVKFRTMHVNAEPNGAVWGDRLDKRCTRFGRILRRWDLDELPQLWNVLRGEMSLVGPRPERPEFVREFKERYPRYMARLRVRAGLTGWAQVHGLRGNTPIDQRIQYDLYYIENWSWWLDLKIVILTLFRHDDREAAEGAAARKGQENSRSSAMKKAAQAHRR